MRVIHQHIVLAVALLATLSTCASPTATPRPPATPTPSPTPIPQPTPDRATLPQDDAPHPGFNTEWWYYDGHLHTDSGDRYSFHYVMFSVRSPEGRSGRIAHVSITDHQRQVYATGQRAERILQEDRASEGDSKGFTLALAEWTMEGYDGLDHISASAEDYAIDLALEGTKPPALHTGDGLVDFKEAGESFYYSRTRMRASGTLTVGGEDVAVSGSAWFDHQWGDFQPTRTGWDWFALQLDDGTDLMLSLVWDEARRSIIEYGTLVTADGRTTHLQADDFQVEATGAWTSPSTGTVYPLGWQVRVPTHSLDLVLKPVVTASEFDAQFTTQNVYWEGAVVVGGSHPGKGFVELVGYVD